jgi:hypothetical protein
MTFRRMADRRPVETLVERDDGVVFAMRGAGGGADLPHDLVHAVVEEQLRITSGIWGCVADGVVWGSMRHRSGRQPPHAAERSARLKRERAAEIGQAEALAGLVGRMSTGAVVLRGEVADLGCPVEELTAAAAELAAARSRWAALVPGQTWVVQWAAPRPRTTRRRREPGPGLRRP